MSAGRILGLLIAVGVVVWLVRSSGFLGRASPETGVSSPAEKARAAARQENTRSAQAVAAAHEAEPPPPGGGAAISENMTPEQIRALLGPPDAVDSDVAADGTARERWTYRQAGKTVVFENGIAVRIE
jgi:hypothetical protein